MTPASSLDDRELVRQYTEATRIADGVRMSELQSEILLRLDAAARPEDEPEELGDLLRANGALAAKCEVLAVLARLYSEVPATDQEGVVRSMIAVAGAK